MIGRRVYKTYYTALVTNATPNCHVGLDQKTTTGTTLGTNSTSQSRDSQKKRSLSRGSVEPA
jgi:hypothetical protein